MVGGHPGGVPDLCRAPLKQEHGAALMPRLRAKVDRNQKQIVAALRKAGWTILHLHQLGHGAPDLLACKHGVLALVEVKMPGEKLTPDEQAWHAAWPGEILIVFSEQEAVDRAAAALLTTTPV